MTKDTTPPVGDIVSTMMHALRALSSHLVQHERSLREAISSVAPVFRRASVVPAWTLLGGALLGLSVGACGAQPSGDATRAGSGDPAVVSNGAAEAPARGDGSSAGEEPAGGSPAPGASSSSPVPAPVAPSSPAPGSMAPVPASPAAPSPAAPSEGQVPGALGVDMPAPNTPGGSSAEAAQTCNLAGAATATTPNIWVVGDSTASLYGSDLFPRMGWAQPLQEYYAAACATVNDRALSGRSSKSFVDEGAWAGVRDALRAGDVVLIQFGHNDEKTEDPLRFTDPATTFRDYLSIYIDDALAHGATPVLLTPIQRNNWTGTTVRETHGAYPDAVRQLAQARGVSLVDATALTKEYFERIGPVATNELFLNLAPGQFPNYPDGNADNTHLREAGAHTIARIILADLARQGSPVGRLVLTAPVAP